MLRNQVESLLAEHDNSGSIFGVPASVTGKVLDHYQALHVIGDGGMGVVYKARDTRLDRLVAIKVLHPWAVRNPKAREQLIREAKCASALNHPHIVTVHEIAQAGHVDFIVMEYVAGKTLAELIPPSGLAPETALIYALQIADALRAAHAAGILHRDLKPTNIMVTVDGRTKLLDFGVARTLDSQRGARPSHGATGGGTRIFMAPEQLLNQAAAPDVRSEMFSFGLILATMLSGRHPFGGSPPAQISQNIVKKTPKALPEKVPVELRDIVLRSLEKDPVRRFQSVEELFDALKRCQGALLSADARPSTGPRQLSLASMREVRSALRRVGHKNLSQSRQAMAELALIIETNASAPIHETVIAGLRDFILTIENPHTQGLSRSVRDVRQRAFETLRLAAGDALGRCFNDQDLEYLDLYGINFANATLPGISFKGCFLVEANFQHCCLAHASFASAYIRNIDLAHADLTGVDFTDADWFNACGLTAAQVSACRRETLKECPATVDEMRRYVDARYGFPFESWSRHVQQQLRACWNAYLHPGGLRDLVASWPGRPPLEEHAPDEPTRNA